MSFRLDQLLKASTVRISTAGKAYEGMGFFFAPGLALTSAHVVQQAEGAVVQVFLPGENHAVPAEVKYRFPDEVGLVILQVQTTEAVPCAYLDADIKPGDQGYTFGCTSTSRKVHRVMLECEGMMGSAIGISHLAGRSKHLELNGSPILNQRTGKVCGIVHTPKKPAGYRGEAVPMGVIFSEFPALSILQKEYHCQDNRWTTLLHPDLEALNADWSYYNRGWIRREQSIRALLFLLRTASQWSLIGARMHHVFPWRSIISLIKATFRGTLGTEIQRQYHQITRQLTSTIDPHSTSQARALHRLDAQSWVVSSMMEMLITPEQDYASSSRLLWMLEILQEQRVYVQTLKRMPGNFYPQLEEFKRRWKLLEHDEKYIDTSRVLSGLINRNTDTNFSLWYTIKFFLKDFILDLAQNSKLSAHGLERLFNMLVVNLRHAVPAPTASVEDLLRDLEEEVRLNPDLKVLQKVQILMTSVSGEVVQGGAYRALKGSGTYHFSAKCKLYPERAQAEEMARIICYDTEAEARQQHKPCKNCLTAEKMLDRRLSDWHDSEPTTPDLNAPVPSSAANHVTVLAIAPPIAPPPVVSLPVVSNLITPDFRAHSTSLQVPVTDRAMAAAPAADAPMPELPKLLERPQLPEVRDIALDPVVLEPLAPIQTANVPAPVVEPEHHDDVEAVAAQVEVEIAAAIAEVAQAIAAERDQIAAAPQTAAPQTVKQPVAQPDIAALSTTDLHALNTDESIEDEPIAAEAEEVFAMAAFFVPDGDQPAIELTETPVAKTPVVETPVVERPVVETLVAETPVVETKTPVVEAKTPVETPVVEPIAVVEPAKPAAKAKTNSTKARATKQTKTLKDFVAAISSAGKLDTHPVANTKAESKVKAAAAVKAEVKPEVKAEVKPEVKTEVKPEVKATAVKATEVKATEVKAEPKVKATAAPATAAKPAATPPQATAPTPALTPDKVAATPNKVAAKASAQSAKSVKVSPEQLRPVPDRPETSPTTTKKASPKTIETVVPAVEPTAVAPTEVAPTEVAPTEVAPTKTKAKSGKVTRLADWVPTETGDTAESEPVVVSINDAKSARTKRRQAAFKPTTNQD